MRFPFVFFCALALMPLAGCSTNEAPATDSSPAGQAAPPPAAVEKAPAPPAESASAPMAGGDPMAPLTPTPEMDQKIAQAQKGSDRKAIGAAYAARGTFRMLDEQAGARVKYRAALDDYRKALAADPKNEEAAKYKKQIEDIYRSMGRPVPGEDAP